MALSKRKDRREGKHGQGSYKKKSGPKKTPKGKQDYAAKWQRKCALETANWKLKIPKLIASLALSGGESMDGGEARMALRVTCQVIEEADLKFDPVSGKSQVFMHVMSAPLRLQEVPPLPSNGCSILCSRATGRPTKSRTPRNAGVAPTQWRKRLCTKSIPAKSKQSRRLLLTLIHQKARPRYPSMCLAPLEPTLLLTSPPSPLSSGHGGRDCQVHGGRPSS